MTYGLIALAVTLGLGALLYFWLGWNPYWVWLIVVNVVTFLFFRYDKRQAGNAGATRVPEVILLGMELLGGVVGGLAGMIMPPRHKTRKPVFWIVLAIAAAIHGYLLWNWLF
jgi:uncharacterized membrane protein YsdA (DUF1294 family)